MGGSFQGGTMNSRKIKGKLEYIVLHHTTIPQRYSDLKHTEILQNEVRNLYPTYDFGGLYHYVVLPSGNMYNPVPVGIYAPHCGLNYGEGPITNDNSIAIAVSGNLMFETLSEKEYQTLLNEVKYQSEKYNLKIVGHRDVLATACPGANFPMDRLMKDLRSPVKEQKMLYKDVDENRWSFEAIEYVTRAGIMTGDEDGFRPSDPCTREELAQVIYNLQRRK
jgi:N-acetyl-anhydromuramyl-L-alanine amidase AmpD